MTEEKEPQTFDDFFKDSFAKVKKVIEEAKVKRLQRDQTPREKLVSLRNQVVRGERVRNFLDGEFWKEDLEPMLRGEASLKPWAPGDPLPLDEVATKYLSDSGKVLLLEKMLKKFSSWVREAEEAKSSLERENDRQKKIDQIMGNRT